MALDRDTPLRVTFLYHDVYKDGSKERVEDVADYGFPRGGHPGFYDPKTQTHVIIIAPLDEVRVYSPFMDKSGNLNYKDGVLLDPRDERRY